MIRPRILLADDHVIVAEGLSRLLAEEFELVGIVGDGRELVAAAKKLRPDVVVADISMPHLNGIAAVEQLRKDNPQIKAVFLTMHQDPAYARRAMEAGAQGFVLKHSAALELVLAIKAALKGKTFITPALAIGLVGRTGQDAQSLGDPVRSLTPRQHEILHLLVQGRSAKEIGVTLEISPRTVEFHKYQMMQAHGLRNNAELIHFAIKCGIVAN